ncbi:unnamed protein product [Echinostoma caproni]|uniref:Uncharacterized protein n=1 Tax=Echinostoma caproni TaxID=27848 RepID=A0A183AK39_9TREM|nr:unnamed protein product [Echinostoma caproni]
MCTEQVQFEQVSRDSTDGGIAADQDDNKTFMSYLVCIRFDTGRCDSATCCRSFGRLSRQEVATERRLGLDHDYRHLHVASNALLGEDAYISQ